MTDTAILIDSTHLIARGDEHDLNNLILVPALENIDGNLVEAHNCWEFSREENGTFSLFSYAPINEHYGSYPAIVFDEKTARELLTFLQTHLTV
jgi:hypothetical protein